MINTLVISGGVAAALLAGAAFAQTAYPTKPIRVINPFPPGGSIDVVARPVFDRLRGPLGQPLVMDFRPGGGTLIGASLAAKSPPDGYTLYAAAGQHAIIQSVYRKLPFDVVRDFAAVVNLATGPYLLVVHPSVPAKNVKALLALAKASPGKLNFSSAGAGSGFHMAGELLKLISNTNIAHIPYNGGAPAAVAVLSGEVDMTFGSPAVLLPHLKSGRARALAVSTLQRFAPLPEVPTMREAGLPGFEAASWYGLFAPAGTAREIIDRLVGDINTVLKSAEIKQVFERLGLEPAGGTADDFRTQFLNDIERWAKVAKAANVRVD
ncbi:MAG: tripartite tricarboxylate transporter substrate binding protein [Betaproteobacteria bacterium]|nr:tripartite tricarboxylate transporter substrate binding protein [Betaproteobacteria bacterium]